MDNNSQDEAGQGGLGVEDAKEDSDTNGTKQDEVPLSEEDLAFGADAAFTDYTNMGKEGHDIVTGLPASDTIQEDFEAEAHAAGMYKQLHPLSAALTVI
jgi:hypothetical protein